MRGRVISKNWGKLNVGQIVSIKEKQNTTIEIRLFLHAVVSFPIEGVSISGANGRK